MKLIHSSPLGGLEIPTVPGVVPVGVPFDVADDIGESLIQQTDLYAIFTTFDELTVPQLRIYAEAESIDLAGAKTKTDILAAIDAAAHEGVEE